MNKEIKSKKFLQDLEKSLGYVFRDKALLIQALTHPSLEGIDNFQRLEFLGDRVLGFVISGELYRAFRHENEGCLSRRLANLVRKETLVDIAYTLKLEHYIQMTNTARKSGKRAQQSILADGLEAIIGALYLDGGLNVAEVFIKQHWKQVLDSSALAKDAKSALQEWAQGRGKPLPEYSVVEQKGPHHAPNFLIRVSVEGMGSADAEGASKQEAETKAASSLLSQIKKNS